MNFLNICDRGPRFRLASLLLASAALVSACGGGGGGSDTIAPPDAPTASFQPLGMPASHVTSDAVAISAGGLVVAGTAKDASGRDQAFRWTVGAGFTTLGFLPGGSRSAAADMSADGSVIVGGGDVRATPSQVAFRWSSAGGMQALPTLPQMISLCVSTAVSGDGQVVVGTCLGAGNSGFRWTEATGAVSLGRFGGGMSASSTASAISDDGQVIGGAGNPILRGAMLWPHGQEPLTLGHLAAGDNFASVSALSADGRVAAGVSIGSESGVRMYRWTVESGMTAIPGTPADVTEMNVRALSADGSVLVGSWTRGGVESAVIWDAARGLRPLVQALAEERRLSLPGWTLQRANAVTPDGRVIAGTGLNPQGMTEAWIVRLN
ncbi:MAG: PEP-CTERM sorting domain-containing protein [Pseudomonadota bacterium]